MAAFANLTREERLGLGVAVVAHAALAAALMVQADRTQQLAPPERMTVSLADEVSLEDTAPDPSAQPAAAFAPTLSDVPEPLPLPEPEPLVRPEQPREVAQPRPQPRPSPAATRAPRPTPTPTARPSPARASPAPRPSPTRTAGGSRIGADFLQGSSDAEGNRGSPATEFGAREAASLRSAITRQLKPHWSAPSGVDADQLVTVLSWELNADGSLKGTPRVVSQSGINDSNRPQAQLHAERAIRSVQLAAPFNLPDQFYDQWKRVREWRFDRRL